MKMMSHLLIFSCTWVDGEEKVQQGEIAAGSFEEVIRLLREHMGAVEIRGANRYGGKVWVRE